MESSTITELGKKESMKMRMIAILNRWTTETLWTGPARSLGEAVVAANLAGAALRGADISGVDLMGAPLMGADLMGADLAGADLAGANLRGANIAGADLRGADLSGADLMGANIAGADLRGANIRNTDLTNANLAGANLAGADLTGVNLAGANIRNTDLTNADLAGANLAGADLAGANLAGADLTGVNLTRFREDVEAVLALAPDEVPGLLLALREGRIDGSCYHGTCACLVGTIANLRGVEYSDLGDLRPDADRPAERWFMAIRPGHTAEQSQVVSITIGWLEAWQAARAAEATLHTTRRTHG